MRSSEQNTNKNSVIKGLNESRSQIQAINNIEIPFLRYNSIGIERTGFSINGPFPDGYDLIFV